MQTDETTRLQTSESFTQEAIRDFADRIGDPNVIHQGPYLQGDKPRKQIVVGLQLLGVFSKMAAAAYPGAYASAIQAEFRWPVYAGETATFICNITKTDAQKKFFSGLIQVGNRVCATGSFTIITPKAASS